MKMLVTPGMAQEWLSGNTANRSISPDRVKAYARDMTSGFWVYNGETIKRTADGVIIDGQHRLEAIVLSGVAVEVEVIEDLLLDVQATIDMGRGRSVSDTLGLKGEQYTRNLAAVSKRIWQWEQGNVRFGNNPAPTPSEIQATLIKYPSLRRSAEMGARMTAAFKPSKASVMGTVHHLFNQVDKDDAAAFFAYFETGAEMPLGHPVLALRNRYTQDRANLRATPFHVGVGCSIRCWNAMRKGESMSIVKMTADSAMPMPI